MVEPTFTPELALEQRWVTAVRGLSAARTIQKLTPAKVTYLDGLTGTVVTRPREDFDRWIVTARATCHPTTPRT